MQIPQKLTLTFLALLAFAGNSVLCRWALVEYQMDPASFTLLRLASGAAVLIVLAGRGRAEPPRSQPTSWWGALWLLVYAAGFGYAYVGLATGIGALILFTAVQFTMLGLSALRGERHNLTQIVGICCALGGFGYLVLPQFSQPLSLASSVLMISAGIAWGAYSTLGRGALTPLKDTKVHFGRALILGLPLVFLIDSWQQWSVAATVLALSSGAITSAVGYAIWFKVLPQLRVTTAAVAQLSVPIIAALGGNLFVGEAISQRFTIASGIILISIFVVIKNRGNITPTK
ncbi:hypothetical protein PSI9734_00795 [Pseudidiomarina piscicola]|uniref:EamA domain-containing protein n=1 Tax=Pseudidiomarina piscicola TaxID=2614830 RepID=A0A6S6WM20_9GAMM|nr:DMT family transporter [Pseudidiomarina piscicola]CAB0150239.1 hypothetical protein PSI9734_00795 [Pseudidiomarina piscicola]VZT39669.1 hypothetical protein PSI9734_00795 [Pseudomonas aeruginosa]